MIWQCVAFYFEALSFFKNIGHYANSLFHFFLLLSQSACWRTNWRCNNQELRDCLFLFSHYN